MDRKKLPIWSRVKNRSRELLIPPARAYVRHFPIHAGKTRFFERIVNPYLQWRDHDFVARTTFGAKMLGRSSEILQQYVYYFGVWEPNLTQWIQDQLRPGDGFVDVGANVGYFSLLASQLVGDSGAVIAVEPSPHVFRLLEANLRKNRSRNVRAVHAAASDSRGCFLMHEGPATHTGLTSFLENPDLEEEFEIEALPLTDILKPHEMKAARLIKIDVEGAEALVVEGMRDLLDQVRSDLEVIVEVSPKRLASQGRQPEEIRSSFRAAGFHAYSIENDYSWQAYLPPRALKRPIRLRKPIESETDVIFSRREAEML